MQNQVGLESISDVKELKALKSDQYDLMDAAQRQFQTAKSNIQALNTRIAELELATSETKPKKA